MSENQPTPTLRALVDDLPPLPEQVWERTLAVAFDPDTVVDGELVPEQDEIPIVPGDDELDLVDLSAADLDDTDPDDTDADGTDAGDGVQLDDTDEADVPAADPSGDHDDGGDVAGIDLDADFGDPGTDPAEHSGHDAGHDPDLGVHPGDDLL